MRQQIITILLLSAVVFLLISCKEETARIGEEAPTLAAFDLAGNPVNLPNHQAITLLTFWSESCGVCLAELQQFSKLQQQYPEKLQILAINIDGEKANTAQAVQKYQLTIPVGKDQLNISAERYQVIGTPTSFIIQQGKILAKYEGLIPIQEITQLL
ncbi:TlpA family protein disulfide reductase [Volucribacter amazonae]|uniref:Thioredoxin n=1 Tax=Volucribacter amazonae TaxID=256731 RepID=A0A9X4PBR9_9PAST|nr:TlpA disulfide reductase family protein [Volucribacter amazonae]MDG6894646.1 thioredoxin [Volucribacter amazonae]